MTQRFMWMCLFLTVFERRKTRITAANCSDKEHLARNSEATQKPTQNLTHLCLILHTLILMWTNYQKHNDKHCTKHNSSVQNSESRRLTVQKKVRKTKQGFIRTCSHHPGWCLYQSPITSLCCFSPSSMGDSVNTENSWRVSGEKKNHRSSQVDDKKAQFTYCHP